MLSGMFMLYAYVIYSTENQDCFCIQKLFKNKTRRIKMITDGLENRHQLKQSDSVQKIVTLTSTLERPSFLCCSLGCLFKAKLAAAVSSCL